MALTIYTAKLAVRQYPTTHHLRCVSLAVIVSVLAPLHAVRADSCDDQCRIQIPFGNVVDPGCAAICRAGLPTPPPPPPPPGPDVVIDCIRSPSQCPGRVLSAPIMDTVRPVWNEYRRSLFRQADGNWTALPSWFQNDFKEHYPGLDLSKVRYVEGIDTKHGQAITIGNRIFFPDSIRLTYRSGKRLMLHELEHVVQYQRRGGEDAFIPEYLLKGAAEIINRKSVNIHDFIELERSAESKAQAIIQRYGRDIAVKNACQKGEIKIVLAIAREKGDLTKYTSTYTVASGKTSSFTMRDGTSMRSNDSPLWYLAWLTASPEFEWGGDLEVTIGNNKFKLKQFNFNPTDDAPALITLNCN